MKLQSVLLETSKAMRIKTPSQGNGAQVSTWPTWMCIQGLLGEAWDREPTRLVLLGCLPSGNTILMSLNTFWMGSKQFLIISMQKWLTHSSVLPISREGKVVTTTDGMLPMISDTHPDRESQEVVMATHRSGYFSFL